MLKFVETGPSIFRAFQGKYVFTATYVGDYYLLQIERDGRLQGLPKIFSTLEGAGIYGAAQVR